MTNRLIKSFRFLIRVYQEFYSNQGFLLSGAVAYYTLLSIIPMALLFIIGLSSFVSEDYLIVLLRGALGAFGESQADMIAKQVEVAYLHRDRIGLIGLISLLLFSGLAFRTLQTAIASIFAAGGNETNRATWLRWLIPYCYVLGLAISFTLITMVAGFIDVFAGQEFTIFERTISFENFGSHLLSVAIVFGEVVLFSLIYQALPAQPVLWRHALIGGLVATLLWEITRRVVIWFSTTISTIDVLYGSFAVLITLLVALEAAAIILLFGAQTIALYNQD